MTDDTRNVQADDAPRWEDEEKTTNDVEKLKEEFQRRLYAKPAPSIEEAAEAREAGSGEEVCDHAVFCSECRAATAPTLPAPEVPTHPEGLLSTRGAILKALGRTLDALERSQVDPFDRVAAVNTLCRCALDVLREAKEAK